MRGQCRSCMRRREVHRAQRKGGGTYRRGGRFYWSSICEPCARSLLDGVGEGQSSVSRWSVRGLRYVVEVVAQRDR